MKQLSFNKNARTASLALITGLLAAVAVPSVASAATAPEDSTVVQVSMGDSITRGAAIGGRGSTLGSAINNPAANWSTGTDLRVYSHLQRLQTIGGVTVKATNLSVGGTTSANIATQAGKAPASVDYATIMTGGNDICQSPSVAALPSKATYKANIAAGVTKLLQSSPDARVLLVSVPNMSNLYAVGKTDATANAVHQSNRVCPVALGTNSSETAAQASARRAAVDTRIKEYNAALNELAAASPSVYSDNGAAYNLKFTIQDISTADYFHPSYSGHAKLADVTWKAAAAQGVFNRATPTQTPTPAPAVAPTLKLNSPSSTTLVAGRERLVVDAKSDSAISSVTAVVKNTPIALTLTKSTDGLYYSEWIDTSKFASGKYVMSVTGVDADGDKTVISKNITLTR